MGRRELDLTPQMDIFSAGCVIAETYLEGEVLFDLSQLLSYRQAASSALNSVDIMDGKGMGVTRGDDEADRVYDSNKSRVDGSVMGGAVSGHVVVTGASGRVARRMPSSYSISTPYADSLIIR